MVRKATNDIKSGSAGMGMGCCQVESVISVDDRGQLVLPKDIREKAGIKAGDKLAVVSWEKEGKTCCIALIKAEGLAGMVRGFLGPLFGELQNKE